MTYQVVVEKRAEKELSKLPPNLYPRIINAIVELGNNPRPRGCRKLEGYANHYRIRIGDYRVIYTIEDKILYVQVIGIANRKDAYK